jgi:hypothetical protein
MLRLLFPNLVKSQKIAVIIKPICEHNPKAQSTVYPETPADYNEVQQNLRQQLKNQYDTKRSN